MTARLRAAAATAKESRHQPIEVLGQPIFTEREKAGDYSITLLNQFW